MGLVVIVWCDWSTSFKVRTSLDITPAEWRAAKDEAQENYLCNFIGDNEQHILHFICDHIISVVIFL